MGCMNPVFVTAANRELGRGYESPTLAVGIAAAKPSGSTDAWSRDHRSATVGLGYGFPDRNLGLAAHFHTEVAQRSPDYRGDCGQRQAYRRSMSPT